MSEKKEARSNPRPKKRNYFLRLYIADGTPQSMQASRNLRDLCEKHLNGHYKIEVVDLVKNPELARDDQIVAVPTLVRKLPSPIRRFIGNLSNPERVLIDFDLQAADATTSSLPSGGRDAK